MTRLLCSILLFLAAFRATASTAPVRPATAETEPPRVAVIFALKSSREHLVPWHRALTIEAAVHQAGGKKPAAWKEAWRYRESFWTRNFRNPHSFWARVLAGERATGYTYVRNTPGKLSAATLRPGDRIYVDLAPIQ